ncbi:DeoR/GlpR family DNA-binding transcription regulator [uncultured Mitsuokella sp.]|mgnify:FL=1|uniref:DeoR/GlpR family DNA-binding transcription regulator n=1 Tax=uncultured Mitsuokella sp. TaxID=453120 RepID=UPI00262C09C7|nr:DeoR/GlpR family DNA-binding transcription regulator [uncultured Mitsuokella sp.]
MLGAERRQRIMDILGEDGKVYVAKLATEFQVTEETVRRDLEKLECQNLLQRSYGGAVPSEATSADVSFARRSSQNQASKLQIAEAAHSLIHDGDTIMVDSSTTCQMLLNRLAKKQGITVITNSIRLMYDFRASAFRMVCTGGNFRASSCSLTGPVATRMLAGYHADDTIISCKAIDLAGGLMESNDSESEVKEIMMQQARRVILLVDHSKFDKTALVRFGDIGSLSYLITDREPHEEWKKFLAETKVKLLVC